MSGIMRSERRSAGFAELLDAAAAEESWAVDALVDAYHDRLIAFARTRDANDPEGVADVVLSSVLRRLAELRFEVPEQLWAYLCLTARSRIIDEHRRAKPPGLVDDPGRIDVLEAGSDPFEEQIVDREYIDELLAPLTNEQRQVLELRFLEDLSIEETANLTGRTQGAVKGLQRRAINAILAAVAVVLVVLAVRGLTDRAATTETDRGPADQPELVDDTSDLDPGPDPETGTDLDDDRSLGLLPGPVEANGGEADTNTGDGSGQASETTDQPGDTAGASPALESDGAASDRTDDDPTRPSTTPAAGPPRPEEVIRLSEGETTAADLNTSGTPGVGSTHGVRIRCQPAHLAPFDPINAAVGQPATALQLFWGNTTADLSVAGPNGPVDGAVTCEGGTSDRSAYWMPAVLRADGAVADPELILVEYKAFGGPDFDRSTIQPIPPGLQLVAEPEVANSLDRVGGAGADEDGIMVRVLFPTCLRVDPGGRPVLSSPDRTSHLSYPAAGERANDCPDSHPYRIPQLGYLVFYDLPWT
ncbi:MAG: sigma-70 family RNA polymerase sigma factor, partial [Actinomycetota bacterium]